MRVEIWVYNLLFEITSTIYGKTHLIKAVIIAAKPMLVKRLVYLVI